MGKLFSLGPKGLKDEGPAPLSLVKIYLDQGYVVEYPPKKATA